MRLAAAVMAAVVIGTHAASAFAASPDKDVQKTIKVLINSIRYEKDDMAAKQVAFDVMIERLMGDAWKDVPDGDRKELIAGMEKLIRGISFPAGRGMFKYLDNILYEPVRVEGGVARCKSTVVIHRDLKKTEVAIDWVLAKSGAGWKVYDTVMLGESTLEGIREEQIGPLLKEGGVPAVMRALRTKLAELEKK